MSCLVLAIATGEYPHYKYTLPNLAEFARVIGADLHIERGPKQPWPHGTWAKLDVVKNKLEYDRIIFLDADLYIDTKQLSRDKINLFLQDGVSMALDQGQPKCSERFVGWCKKNYGEDVKPGLDYFNAGVMSWDKKPLIQLLDYFEAFNFKTEESFHEQDFINMFFQKKNTKVSTLPKTFNLLGVPKDLFESPLIVHFVADFKKIIPFYYLFKLC